MKTIIDYFKNKSELQKDILGFALVLLALATFVFVICMSPAEGGQP